MAQLLFYPLHVVDFIRTGISTRSYRLVILDAEVDARDGIFAR